MACVPPLAWNEQGRGEVNAVRAASLRSAANPNAALNRFLVADPPGGSLPVFNAAVWSEAAWNEAAWLEAAWSEAAWSESSKEDNAEGEAPGETPALTPEAELAADPELQLPLEALLP